MSVANLPNYRHVLQTFITQSDGKQLISHQIESFNQFIEVDIPEIIHMSNPVTSYGSPEIPLAGPRSALATATGLSTTAANALMGTAVDGTAAVGRTVRHEYEVTLEFEKISIRKPTIFENNGAIHPMMPNDARLRNLTYAAPLNVDVKVTTTFIDHTRNSIREANVRIFPNVHLGKIPIMVGSKYCLLHDQKHVHPSKMGECAEDVGGYFIVQGGERAMISMERMSENRPFVFRNGRVAAKQLEMVEIKCIGPDNDQVPKSNTIKIVYHPKNQLITMLRATIPRIKTDIPVAILFRALGILADMDMYELILGHIEKGSEEAYDSIMTETILEGSSICTQEQAYAWLAEHTNTWSVKSQKQTNVQDILSEELFPHIGGKEMNYEKACFLAHMCRKVLWTISKRIPTDDRDAYPNKRVDIPGFLLADLFRKTYNNRMVKDMKAALSKEIHGGSWKATGNWTEIVNINNINKIIKSTIMDVCLKSSLATGNFGCGKIGGPNKVGVSQVLNRMNYSASISHLRRISTPIEKTGKLIAPRKQHNSQAFYVCVRGNTAILQGDGMTSREIISMKDGDQVITADATTLAETPSAIHHYFKTTPRAIIEFVTLSGRTIGCSPDHPLLIMRENGESEWIHACDVQQGDSVVVKNYTVPVATDNGKEPLVITREMITAVDSSEKRIDALSRFFREVSEDEKQILARLIGASATDGTLTKVIYGYSGNFYVGEVADALAIRADIERLGFASRPYRKRNTVFNKPGERTVEYQCYDVTVGGAIATLLVALGGLVGKKGMTETPVVPSWIMNGSSAVKREFLSAFQGGDGCRIKGANRTCISMGRTQQTCSTAFATGHRAYMEQINALFAEFGVKTWVTAQNNGEKTIHFINFQHTYENFSRYVTTIGYRYCAEKCRTSALYIEYALYRASLQNTKMDTVDQIRTLRADGMTYVQIQHTIEGVMSIESIRRFCQQKDKEVNPSCRNYLTIEEFRAKTRQVDDKIIMPITTIRECEVEDVYDFTTESENHDFYANGILVRNCPCETPEGHGVGVVKNMAVSTGISIFSSPITVYAFLQRMDKLLTLREATVHQKHNDTRVFLNGSWVGVLLCEDTCEVVDRLRKAKRSGILHLHTGIVWKNAFKELWITTEAGRVLRPIYYAPTLREIAANPILAAQIHEIREWNNLLMWRSPTGKALIEYVDAGETDGLYIAMDGAKAIADPSTTHCEIHPSLILGTTASYIPFPDHNQSPRNAYQSSMGKQAMGIYALNFRERFDAMSHVLCYPEVPMVSTYMSRFYGAEKLPAGQNIVVAIMTYTGYNQEDSNMINRAALDRGRFRSIFYRTYKDEERKNQSSGEEEKFCSPDPVETKHMKNAHYDKLAEDGFVPKNTFVTPDDILIGKVVPLRVPTGAVLPAGAKKSRDVSKMPRNNEKGYVDKIYKNRNGEGYSFVKIRMRQDRIPEIGDKFCLTADHDVLTRGRGWVPIADVTMEDEVAQLNRETNTMEYVTPLETLVFDQDGDMYEVESQGVSLHVTMNHRMWVQRRDKPAYELIEASKIMGKRVRYQSAAPVNREDLEITIGEERFREERMDAWLAVLGIWLAEGWTSIRPNDSICRVEFAANKPRVLQKLNACCEALNWKYNYVNSSQKFYINHREITHYLSPLSVGAVNKRVPQWAFELSARQTRILIDGMCLGDGHETATSLHYSTSSVGLRDDLQVLCQHAGWTSYYAKRYEAGHQNTMKDGRIITNTHDNWDIGIRRTRLYPTMNHGHVNEQDGQAESVHPFTGKVYCLRVPSEVFLVRRHARIVWTGNSSRHGSNEPQCGIKPMLVRCCP